MKNNTPVDNNKAVDIGNASNAGPTQNPFERPTGDDQLLNQGAEKYIRQVTSPEEMPDAAESEDTDEKDPTK